MADYIEISRFAPHFNVGSLSKEFYMPKDKPSIITVPSMNYIKDYRGQGIGTWLMKKMQKSTL